MTITDPSRASTPTQGPSTTPLPTLPRRLANSRQGLRVRAGAAPVLCGVGIPGTATAPTSSTDPNRGRRAFVLELLKQSDSLHQIGETRPGYVVPATAPTAACVRSETHKTAAMHQPTTLHLPGAALQQLPRRLASSSRDRPWPHAPTQVVLRQAARYLPFVRPRRDRASTRSDRTGTFEGCTRILLQTRMHATPETTRRGCLTQKTRHETG